MQNTAGSRFLFFIRSSVRSSPPHGRDARWTIGILPTLLVVLAFIVPTVATARPLRLVALGDSLTAGYGLPASAAFPAVLEQALRARGRDVTVINAGVNGDTASGGYARVDGSVPDGTDGVILELGANDMLQNVDPSVTRNALAGIIARLKARGIPVLLAGMRSLPERGPSYVARFEAIYPGLARSYGVTYYPFFLQNVVFVRGLNLSDNVHPNAAGVQRIVANILPTVERFLARIAPRDAVAEQRPERPAPQRVARARQSADRLSNGASFRSVSHRQDHAHDRPIRPAVAR